MSELAQLDWRNPWWLLLALQPVLLTLLAWRGRRRALDYADAHLRPWAVRGGLAAARWSWRGVLSVLAWVLLACAAAGPRLPLVAAPEGGAARVHDMDIIVVLDVSPSMLAADVSPQRLQRARLELTDLLQRLRGERIGLIAFSGAAGVLTPPTGDHAVFAHYLALAEPTLFRTPGSNIAAALRLALEPAWPDAGRTRAVLLVTDGETDAFSGSPGMEATRAAQALRERGVRLAVLLVATPDGAAVPGETATLSRPDIGALRELAARGGGTMEFVRDGDGDWRALYDGELLALPGAAPAPERVEAWRELYPFALAPAVLLFLLAQWPPRARRAAEAVGVVAVVALASLLPIPAHATEADAYAAYRAGDFALAQLLYREQRGYAARLGEGAAAYRRGRYVEAAEQFGVALLNATSDAQRADALFNLGNALYRSEKYALAAEAYGGSLALRPDDANARANQTRALARLRALTVGERTLEGVPRRRGLALGETPLGATDAGPPPGIDSQRAPVPEPRRGERVAGGERAAAAPARDDARAAQLDTERDYRAALKKLELVDDHPADMLKALIELDTPRPATPPAELPPW
jgi:Ca-activated chloride channel family protein